MTYGKSPTDVATSLPLEKGFAFTIYAGREEMRLSSGHVSAQRHPSREYCEKFKTKFDPNRSKTDALLRRFVATRDQKLRDQLVNSHQNLVRYIAIRFQNKGEIVDDLIQVGNIGLVNALDRYDPAQHAQFSTYAVPTIIGEIKRHFRDKTWHMRVPRSIQDMALRTRKVCDRLTVELGHCPSPAELAEHMNEPEDTVLVALEAAHVSTPISYDAHLHMDSGSNRISLLDSLGAVDPQLHDMQTNADLRWAIDCLSQHEQNIIRLRYFNDLSQYEVAEALNTSQMQVSRLQRRALKRLNEFLVEAAMPFEFSSVGC
jgi:RNA polymerase sigma-B factor